MKMIRCTGCDRPILDRFLLNVLDRPWHTKCVRCCDCKCSLAEKCFSRDGELYCKKDFFGRFGTRCGGCAQGICPNDLVRRTRNRIFHLDCFTCMMCNKRLSTGDELYVIDKNTFVCKEDYLSSSKAKDTNIVPVPAFSDASVSPDSQDARDTKDSEIGHLSDKEENENEIDDQDISGKRRGPRTTIKAKQLETLEAAFAASSKPTRHTREQLAQETGLHMRVIQVWFQNRRSKERRVKHLSALDAGRHTFSRSPTPRLVDRLETRELIQSSHFSHYGDYLSEYYSPGSNCDYFPQGPPPPQGPTPTDQTPSPGPSGTPYGGINPEDSTPREPGTLLCAPPSETFSSAAHFTILSLDGNGYSSNLSHPASELSKGAVW